MHTYLVDVTDGEKVRRMPVTAEDHIFAIMSATMFCEGTAWRVISAIDYEIPNF
jgi:hypothetical protein